MEDALRRLIGIVLLVLVFLWYPAGAWSAGEEPAPVPAKERFFTEVGFLTGYGHATLSEGDYETVPLILHLGIDMRRWFQSLEARKSTFTLYFEPQVNYVPSPDNDAEFGLIVGLKAAYPLTEKLAVYGCLGTGPLFITVKTVDQANGFNFGSYVGAGVSYSVQKDTALNLGYRLRHVSNANLRSPNPGIDSNFLIVGVSVFY
jgi:opacity protein-like surface antigen